MYKEYGDGVWTLFCASSFHCCFPAFVPKGVRKCIPNLGSGVSGGAYLGVSMSVAIARDQFQIRRVGIDNRSGSHEKWLLLAIATAFYLKLIGCTRLMHKPS